MAKYSYELKKKVVTAYLNGEGGSPYIAKLYGIPNHSLVQEWVHRYNAFGDKGLMCSRKKKNYSFEKKLSVVKLYLSGEISYQDLAIQEGISNPCLISRWVKHFRTAGPDALRPPTKGWGRKMDKPKTDCKVQKTEERIIDTSAEHVKELEDELLKLRIENAFLKELRRLRLEDEAKARERRSSSTVSEENSD